MGCGLAVLKYFLFVLVYLSLCYSKTLVPKSAKIIANAKEFFFFMNLRIVEIREIRKIRKINKTKKKFFFSLNFVSFMKY